MKIVDAIKEFEFEQHINGLSKKYVALCQHRLNSWKTYMIDELFIDNVTLVTEKHIKLFIRHRQNLGREKNITINNRLATLKVFFKFLVDMGVIKKENNPMTDIKNLKEGRTVITTFTDDEVKQIIDSTGTQTYSNIRDKTVLIFLFETGIRVSELVGLKNSDVFIDRIFIRGKGSHERYVYISKKMHRQMKRFERARKLRFEHLPASMVGDYYFLNQEADGMSRSNVNKILRKAGKKAKVREEIRCSPHDCRHYFAQKQIKQGIDVYSLSRLLGHSNIDITTQYLRGLQMDDVLEIGRRTSPLRDIPIKLIWIKLRNMVQYSQTNNYITGGLRLEKTKKPIFKRWYFWVALIIVLGAVGAGMGEDKESAKGGAEKVATTTAGEVKSGGAEEKSKAAEEEAPKDYKIGDTAEIKNHNVSAVNVERKTSGNYDTAKDGHEFVVVNVKIENGGEKNISYNPMSFKIKTSSGNIVDQAITIVDSNTALSSGELAAGGTVEGTVSFEVPAGDQDLELIYSPNPFTDDSVIIKLQ